MSIKAPCSHLCGKPLKRYHFTCLYCQRRRYAIGEIGPPKYVRADIRYAVRYNLNGALVIPTHNTVYTLIIDNRRRFAWIKKPILRYLLTLSEWMAA